MERVERLSRSMTSAEGLVILENVVTRSYPLHWHEFYELEYIVSGHGVYTLNGVAYPARPGTLFFSTYMDFHDVRADSEIHTLTAEFDERWIDRALFGELYTSAAIPNFDGAWMEQLAQALRGTDSLRLVYAEKLLGCILVQVCRALKQSGDSAQSAVIAPQVKAALQYLHLHFREDLSVMDMAGQLGLSANHLSKLFHEQTGKTLKQHLTALRLDHARRLLRYTDLPVTDICYESGFGSFSAFSRAFLADTAMPPRQYRSRFQTK